MKTLKISLVATVAVSVAWIFHVPQSVWPLHPQFGALLMGFVLCLVLQYAWGNPKSASKD